MTHPAPGVPAPATPDPPPAVALCAAADLQDGGDALVFDLLEYGQPVRGFVLRYQGVARAYLNRCAHVPAEMDWLPGKFLDDSGRWILCSIHGAAYEPTTGHCVAGPCRGKSLSMLSVREHAGQVYWYPERRHTPIVK